MKPIIELICTDMRTEQEGELLRIVQSYGFNIDRTRLMAALTDARRFYNEGYEDGQHSSRWISVEERLPEVHGSYIIAIKQKYSWQTEWEYNVDVGDYGGNYIDDMWDTYDDWIEGQETHVTHWMPLPEPPKEE